MAEHEIQKSKAIELLNKNLNKTLGEIDDKDIFLSLINVPHEKGIAGRIVEQCIFNYPADTEQKPDLIIIDGNKKVPTELKTTGIVKKKDGYDAKEPISITAVSIFEITSQIYENSSFYHKINHLLFVYYEYIGKNVYAYDYRNFPLLSYQFFEFSKEQKETLKEDWTIVRTFVLEIEKRYEDNPDRKELIKKDYIAEKHTLRKKLTYLDLVPKYPSRFRIKKPLIRLIIAEHFGSKYETLPEYTSVKKIDNKINNLLNQYKEKTISFIALEVNIEIKKSKSIAEQIVCSMYGSKERKISKIKEFNEIGIIAKTITVSMKNKRTEDTKLFRIDFTDFKDEKNFEDSQFFTYFNDYQFLYVIFKETNLKGSLENNKLIGLKRVVFSEDFINTVVKTLWEDTKDKVLNNKLKDVTRKDKNGNIIKNKTGVISSAPNFMKSTENVVFIRGDSSDSSFKPELVNGIKMYNQYCWIRGDFLVNKILNDNTNLVEI